MFRLLLLLFLFIPFMFSTQKGEDHLSPAAEWSPSHPLQHCDGRCVYTKHKADSVGFLLVLDPPMAGVQPQVQSMKPLKISLRILQKAWKPGHHSSIGQESIYDHQLQPRALPGCQGWYFAS
jgi:hypothetical protein